MILGVCVIYFGLGMIALAIHLHVKEKERKRKEYAKRTEEVVFRGLSLKQK